MKKTRTTQPRMKKVNDMLPEYRFDYRKARPNRFIEKIDKSRRAILEKNIVEDVALVHAIKEGEATKSVSRAKVFSILEGKA